MNEMVEPETVNEIVKPNIVPSEEWLRKHRERMRCARPVTKPEKGAKGTKGERSERGKPPLVVEPKGGTGGEKEGEALGQPLGLGDGKPLGLGDGWGWCRSWVWSMGQALALVSHEKSACH